MGKVQKQRKKLHMPAASQKRDEDEIYRALEAMSKADETTENAMSRGQRKRQARRDRMNKKLNFAEEALRLRKEEERKLRVSKEGGFDMESILKDVNMEASRMQKKTEERTKNLPSAQHMGGRKLIEAAELKQFNSVLQHPVYQTNPLATLREHIKNTMEATGTETAPSKKKKVTKKGKTGR